MECTTIPLSLAASSLWLYNSESAYFHPLIIALLLLGWCGARFDLTYFPDHILFRQYGVERDST